MSSGRAEFAATIRSDLSFETCDLKRASFRFQRLTATFSDCDLTEADFTEADLTAAAITRCDLRSAQMFKAAAQGLDLRTNNIAGIEGVEHLKGVTLSRYQLLDLAPSMARHIGIMVEEEPES